MYLMDEERTTLTGLIRGATYTFDTIALHHLIHLDSLRLATEVGGGSLNIQLV